MNLGPAAHAPARIIAPVVANPSCLSLISHPLAARFGRLKQMAIATELTINTSATIASFSNITGVMSRPCEDWRRRLIRRASPWLRARGDRHCSIALSADGSISRRMARITRPGSMSSASAKGLALLMGKRMRPSLIKLTTVPLG